MSIFLNGIDAKYITMEAGDKLTPGKVCYTTKNCTADDAPEDESFLGVTKAVRGDLATVQIAGFITLPFSGNIHAPGFHYLCADNKGGVKVAELGGREYLVVEIDEQAGTVGLFL